MVRRQFFCKHCKTRFVVEVFEEGEAEAKRIGSAPVKCPNCRSTDVKRD